MRTSFAKVLAFCIFAGFAVSQTEPSAIPLPKVTAFDCPQYPKKAQEMRLQGMVPVEVTTDCHQITKIKVLPSHPVLAEEAVKNLRTWKLADHDATSFKVTYFYENDEHFKKPKDGSCPAKMELPARIMVSRKF
jgi:Gram-negative bacterial TonB protein C-terminal